MNFVWDPEKRIHNLEKHGCDFAIIDGFRWDVAMTREDTRINYGERRFVSISIIGNRHYVAVWAERDDYRLISLRKANRREVSAYARA